MSETIAARAPRRQLWVVLGLVAVGLLGIVAIQAGNSTSDRVDELSWRNDAFYLRLSSSSHGGGYSWARSDDGGLTWASVETDAVPRTFERDEDARCAADGVCYRRNDEGYNVERGSEGAGWTVEYSSDTVLQELAVNPDDSDQAMLIVDWERIVRRAPDGTWSAVDAAAMATPPAWKVGLGIVQHSQLALVGVGILLCVAGARRYGSAGRVLGVWIGLNVLAGLALSYLVDVWHLTTSAGGVVKAAGLWLAIGLAVLALPVPRRASPPSPEEELR